MQATLPQELLDVFGRATRAELVTIGDHGQPAARSVAPAFDAHAICLEVDVVCGDEDTHVALLFADDPLVLVQGTAKPGPSTTRVRPERVYVWRGADVDAEPELYDSHVEEVRAARNQEPEVAPPPPEGGPIEWDERLDGIDRAVVAFVGPDGFPFAVRVPVHAEPSEGVVRIDADPVGAPMDSGRACLCAGELRVRGDLDVEDGRWTLRPHATVSAPR